MNILKRILKMEMSQRELRLGKRILASIMLPILVFQMTSMNFLAMELMTASAAGSGNMTIDPENVTAGATNKTFKFTFDPTEDMDGGAVRVELPTYGEADDSYWPDFTTSNIAITEKSGADIDGDGITGTVSNDNIDISDDGKTLTIEIEDGTPPAEGDSDDYLDIGLKSNQYFEITYQVSAVPELAQDYYFDTEIKASADGSWKDVKTSDPIITVDPAEVDHYEITNEEGNPIAGQVVGVDFDVLVTAYDEYDNVTNGVSSVEITADDATGDLEGETSADTSSDGTDTLTMKYSKPVTGLRLLADGGSDPFDDEKDESDEFDVANLTVPVISPFNSTNNSIPLISWTEVDGTKVGYKMDLVKKSDGFDCDDDEIYSSPLATYSGENLQYQLLPIETLRDESTYCVKVVATDFYGNNITKYDDFNLLTSKPDAPSRVYIAQSGTINVIGSYPENTINIYNNGNTGVKVEWEENLDGGKVYVKIKDGLNNETSEYSADISGAVTSTTVTGVNTSSLQQGTNLEVYARVEDAGTNASDWESTTTRTGVGDDLYDSVTKDTSSPARASLVTLEDPINVDNENAVNVNVIGEASANAYYTISSSGGGTNITGSFAMDDDGNTDSPNIDISDTGTKLNDGTLTASVYFVDGAWNYSNATQDTAIKDATAPTVILTATETTPTNDSPLHITAQFSETVTGFAVGDITVGNGVAGNFSAVDGDTYTFEITPAGQGTVTVNVAGSVATDGAGNNNTAVTQLSVTYDTMAPTLAFTGAGNDVEASPVISDTIVGDWGDASIKKWTYDDDGTCPSGVNDYANLSTVSMNQTDQTNNSKWVCLYGEDAAGNSATLASANDINIDVTGPTLSLTDNVAAGPVISDTITGSWGDASVKKWEYDADGICPTTAGSYGKIDTDVMSQAVETNNGKYICLYGADTLGNYSTLVSANDINVDATLPVITFAKNVDAGPTNSDTIQITVTETNPDTTSYKYGFSDDATCDGDDTYDNDFTSGTDFNVTDAGLTSKWICTKATDLAGNTSYQTSALALNLDTTNPTIASIVSTNGDGFYNTGDTINVMVNFSENVTLAGGNLNVTLDTGDVIAIAPFAGTNSAVGTYTVSSGDTSADLDSTGIALALGATLRDAAGNDATVSLPVTTITTGKSIVIDTTEPTTTVTIANDKYNAAGWNDTDTINGTAADTNTVSGVAVSIKREEGVTDNWWDGTDWDATTETWAPVTTGGTVWKYTLDDVNLTNEKTYTVKAAATDNAGNVTSSGSGEDSFTYDTAAPTAPTLSTPADGARLNDTTPTLTWADVAKDETSYTIEVDDDSGFGSINFTETVAGTVNTSTVTTLAEGTYYWRVKVKDGANNESTSVSRSFVIDTDLPGISSLTLSDPTPTKAGTVTITVNFDETMAGGVNPTISFGTADPYNQHVATATGWSDGDTFVASIVIPDTGAWDGLNTIKVTGANDVAGNTMAENTANTFTIDTTDPTGTVTVDADPIYEGDLAQTVTVTYNEAMDPASTPTITFGTTTGVVSSAGAGAWNVENTVWTQTFNITDANEIRTDVSVSSSLATDVAGNAEGTSVADDFDIDTAASTITIVNPNTDMAQSKTVTASADGSATLTMAINNAGVSTCDGSLTFGVYSDTTFTAEADNTRTICYRATDPAGNISYAASNTISGIDRTAPTVVLSDDHTDDTVRDADTVVITATFTEADQISEVISPIISINSSGIVDNAPMAKSSNLVWTYSWNVPTENDGLHTVSVTAQDRAGNANTAATGQTNYTIDNVAPVTTLNVLTPDPNNDNTPTFTGNVTEERTGISAIQYRADGGVWNNVTISDGALDELNEDYTFTTGALSNGSHQVDVIATDTAGNTHTASDTFQIDTLPPVVTAGNISVSGNSGTGSYFKRGDSVTATWNNSATGDNNGDVANVTFNFSEFGGGAPVVGTNDGSNSWSASYVLSNDVYLAAKKVSATVTDTASNSTTLADDQTYNVDTENPVVNAGNDQVKNAQFDQDATVTDDTALTYAWSKTSGMGTLIFGAGTAEDTSVLASIDGNYVVRLTATDDAGNSAYDEFNLLWDQTKPNTTVTSQTYDAAGAINVSFSTDSDLSGVVNVELWKSYNGGAWASTGLTSTSTSGTFAFTPAEGDGTYYFSARATDAAGNVEDVPTGTGDDNTIYDTTDPTAPSNFAVVSGTPYNTWSAVTSTNISWTASTDATSGLRGFSYRWDNSSTADLPDNMNSTEGTTWVEDETVVTNSKTFTSDGDWYFHIQPRDVAENYATTTTYGPFKIDTTAPTANHSSASEAVAGVDINVNVTAVADGSGAGIASVKVYYQHHGDSSYTSQDMADNGSGSYSYSIPDEENSDYDVEYYIAILDSVGNEKRFPTSGDYNVDIVSAGVDHFVFTYPTSGTRYAGTWFTVVIEARDQFGNVAEGFDGTGDKVRFTTDEAGVSVFVQENGTNVSGAFDKGIWADKIQFGKNTIGGGVSPTDDNIRLTATDTDAADRTDSVTMTTFGSDFGTTMTATVEGTQDGAETGTGGESTTGGEAVTGGESPVVQGEQDGALVPNEGDQTDNVVAPWWKKYLPWMEVLFGLAFVGWFIRFWIRRRGGGAGGNNLTGIFFSSMKTAASRIRMFLW